MDLLELLLTLTDSDPEPEPYSEFISIVDSPAFSILRSSIYIFQYIYIY